jgi:signal transduction histidine kinase
MIKRLRLKLICINLTLAMGMLLILFGLVYRNNANDIVQMEESALAQAATSKLRPGVPGTQSSTISYFTLRLGTGGVLIASENGPYDLTDMNLLWRIYQAADATGLQTGTLKDYNLRFYKANTSAGPVFAFTDLSTGQKTLSTLLQTLTMIGAGSFLGFLGISILLANWAVKPVASAWQQQRQFIADASHELKTPLTVILTNAELLQSAEYAPEDKAKFADYILTMSRQMRSLVERLLELARADNGHIRQEQVCVDYSELTESAVLPFEPAYFEQGMVLESRIEPGIHVLGNPQYLQQLPEILLDNGLKYAAPTGPVLLSLTRAPRGKCLLTVATPGQPLTPQECKDIFKRFYRRDAARTDRSSYGLGLSIAQQITADHGGKIWAEGVTGGNIFYVLLPEARPTGEG